MAGSPKKRSRNILEARKRQELTSHHEAVDRARSPERRVAYSPELGAQIVELVADGIPVVDVTIAGVTISQGIASRLGISTRSFHRWQKEYPELGRSIARARHDSADLIADQILALGHAALERPEMATAIRVAGDILRWSAAVRNPGAYAEHRKLDVTVSASDDLGERLRRARERTLIDVLPAVVPIQPERAPALPEPAKPLSQPSALPWFAGIQGEAREMGSHDD